MEFLYLSMRGGNLSLSKSSEIVVLGFEKNNNYFLIYFSRSSFCIFSSPGEKAKFILPKGLDVDSSCTQILSAAHHVQLVWKPQKKLYNANPENAGMMIQSSLKFSARRCRFTAPCPFRSEASRDRQCGTSSTYVCTYFSSKIKINT